MVLIEYLIELFLKVFSVLPELDFFFYLIGVYISVSLAVVLFKKVVKNGF